jgi:hypothetical protein
LLQRCPAAALLPFALLPCALLALLVYSVSEVAFIGNSLLEGCSGHNLAEAAVAGCAVLVGEHAGHFSTMADELNQAAVSNVDTMHLWRDVVNKVPATNCRSMQECHIATQPPYTRARRISRLPSEELFLGLSFALMDSVVVSLADITHSACCCLAAGGCF